MNVLRDFHEVLGELVRELEATVGYFAGDGLMVFFNDPIPCPDPAFRAVKFAVSLRQRMVSLLQEWRRLGHELGVGVGISLGYATLGEIGFEGRFDYGAIGSVVNLASRLCGEAESTQVLVSQPAYAAVESLVTVDAARQLTLKGFNRPVPAYNVLSLKEAVRVGSDSRPAGLTEREIEVLRLLAAGASSQEIGSALYLSVRTVDRHVANAYLKIGAHGRADATARAIALGIAEAPAV